MPLEEGVTSGTETVAECVDRVALSTDGLMRVHLRNHRVNAVRTNLP